MSITVSVYSSKAYKDFLLPAINNAETVLYIDHNTFSIRKNEILRLEVIDGKWHFCDTERLYKNKQRYNGEPIGDNDGLLLKNPGEEDLYIKVTVGESAFSVYTKYDLSIVDKVTIGCSEENDIVYSSYFFDSQQVISRRHSVMEKKASGWIITPENGTHGSNGIFINDIRVSSARKLDFGDHINIWGLKMVFLGNMLAIKPDAALEVKSNKLIASVLESNVVPLETETIPPHEKNYYHRAPRNMEQLDTEEIEIEGPPAPREENNMSVFSAVGPALTMIIPMLASSMVAIVSSRMSGSSGNAFMFTGLITAGLSGVIGAFWAIRNMKTAKETARREETRRFDAYSTYLTKCKEEIQRKYIRNTEILNRQYPSATAVIDSDNAGFLGFWNRNRTHSDFLYHRLGLGDIPFQAEIVVPKEKFSVINDALADNPRYIKENFSTLHSVPVGIDLKQERLIGLIGGSEKRGGYPVVYDLVAQIATQNCYTDVKLAFVAKDPEIAGSNKWSFSLWLPHVWSQNKKSRYTAFGGEEASDVCYDLAQIMRQRAEEAGQSAGRTVEYSPHYILIVEDMSLIEGELLSKYIFDKENNLGITTILMVEKYSDLPNACECVIENDDEYKGIYYVSRGKNEGTPISFDSVEMYQLDKLSRKLANVEVNEIETGGEIPQAVTFFDMYGASSLEDLKVPERWRKNRTYETMKSMIGIKSGGQSCFLDLHEKYHGPHGLVAGTTGSGKSETLQTYMLSLAMNFSPDDVGFFIIDYKGGGMGNLFTALPHTLGQISNLSGNQVRRAMVSIKSENLRRQRIFNENGVNNINAYTKLVKSGEAKLPVPHLLIVIDEFAELKREEPDFMRELISVAQVGRSLGVHLILATQKPSGTVDDNIWSNSKFRLCLRVQDRQDSSDMLHKPDAAYITQTGRGYLQVGNDELYELFQSGWSGAVFDETSGSSKQVIATMITNTGRTGLVGNHAKSRKRLESKIRWIKKLLEGFTDNHRDAAGEESDFECVYRLVESLDYDFARTDYNSRLVRNFITLREEAVKQYGTANDDVIAEFIAENSARRGMKIPEAKEKTQLDAVVNYLAELSVRLGYQKQQPLWLPVLSDGISLDELSYERAESAGQGWPEYGNRWELKAPVGLCDDPVNQYQMPLVINFTEDGSHAVCGISMSGKSTLIQTLLYSLFTAYSPEYLNAYILDFGNRMMEAFEEDPHVGGILYETDTDTVGKFFHMLQDMLSERKALFKGGNYSQFTLKNGVQLPAVIVVIDNYTNFREKTEEKYDDQLIRISRECAANGIYLLVSGVGYGIADIPGKLGENIHKNICLELQDRFGYADLVGTTSISAYPDSGVPGRGLVSVDGVPLVFQTCVALKADDDYGRIEGIKEECLRMKSIWTGKKADPIPFIPEKPQRSVFVENKKVQDLIKKRDRIPIGYNLETADIESIDLRQSYCYMVTGKGRTGKTNLLKEIALSAQPKQGKTIIVEFGAEELRHTAEKVGAQYIDNFDDFFDFVQSDLINTVVERNNAKKSWKAEGLEDSEIFERMSEYQPYFIIIADMISFTETLHSMDAREKNVHGAMTNFFNKGSLLGIYYFAAMKWERPVPVAGKSVYDSFVQYKQGIYLGGDAENQSLFEFRGLSYRELANTNREAGYGITASTDTDNSVRIVVPLAKG